MKPRILVSLEPLPRIAAQIPGVDDLDIAYACARAGAAGIIVGVPADSSNRDSLNRFDRPGLPLLCVHVTTRQIDMLGQLGSAPDRFLISDDGRPLTALDPAAQIKERLNGTHQQVAALIDTEPNLIKLAIRARIEWLAFSTYDLQQSESRHAAEQELARLRTASVLCSRNGLRVMLYGNMDQHLVASMANLEGVEELAPVNTLWSLALRHGWEQAIDIFLRWT